MILDKWIAQRLGVSTLTRGALLEWQNRALREIIARASAASPFYARYLSGVDASEPGELPFMDLRPLAEDPLALLCVPQGAVARAATLETSGTRGSRKRLFFTDEDLEDTKGFFAAGMAHIPGSRTLIAMSGERPGSVGALLAEALGRIGRVGFAEGPVSDPSVVLGRIAALNADSLVGVPAEMLALARTPGAGLVGPLRSVLLSGDIASRPLVAAVEAAFGCPVFRHYGMAETGYGAAVECARHEGMHIREADLLMEVVDGEGKGLDDGEWGEIVVTTLTRRALPLIRYRTGDEGRILPGPCPCGSVLRRLEVRGRLDDRLMLSTGTVHLGELDETLHALPWLLGFDAAAGRGPDGVLLRLTLYSASSSESERQRQAESAVRRIPAVRGALQGGTLRIECAIRCRPDGLRPGKKRILPLEKFPSAPNGSCGTSWTASGETFCVHPFKRGGKR